MAAANLIAAAIYIALIAKALSLLNLNELQTIQRLLIGLAAINV